MSEYIPPGTPPDRYRLRILPVQPQYLIDLMRGRKVSVRLAGGVKLSQCEVKEVEWDMRTQCFLFILRHASFPCLRAQQDMTVEIPTIELDWELAENNHDVIATERTHEQPKRRRGVTGLEDQP